MTKEELKSLTIEQLNSMKEDDLDVITAEVLEKLSESEIKQLSTDVRDKLGIKKDSSWATWIALIISSLVATLVAEALK